MNIHDIIKQKVNIDSFTKRQHLAHILNKTSKVFLKLVNRKFTEKQYNITHEQFLVLILLSKAGKQKQQFFADILEKDKVSITKLVDALENRSLVKRVASKTDRRVKLVTLTEDGIKLCKKLLKVVEETSFIARQGIDNEELDK